MRTRDRHAAVHQRHQQGRSIAAIGRQLGLNRRTVRRFVRAERVEDLLVESRSPGSRLDAVKPYLHQRSTPGTPTPRR
jgi:transposase-like protein